MKRRIAAVIMGIVTIFSMTGCGDKETSPNGTEAVDSTGESGLTDVDLTKYEFYYLDYVTLCDYSAVPVTLSESYERTREDAEAYFEEWFNYMQPFYVADESKTVIEEGDIVDVNYVGTLDGVAFDGGSAENQIIDVSGNCMAGGATTFIPGFTDGLLGASVGEVVDCDVTFPESYDNTDLAGKAVVFTFTVNAIEREMSIDEVDDAFAQEYAGEDTVEAMYEMILSNMTDEAEYNKNSELNIAIQEYLMENCTVELPEDYVADLFTAYKNWFIMENCDGDESQLEGYLSDYYGCTVEEAEEGWKEEVETQAKLEFIFLAIAEKEGIELDQAGFEAEISDMTEYYALDSADSIYESYGYGDIAYGEAYMKLLYIANSTLDQIKETAVVTINAAENETESETTER